MKRCYGSGPDEDCGDCYLKSACYSRFMADKEYSNAELTEIYHRANNTEIGKSVPITTQRVFTAMRECLRMKRK
jgi:hypothetical protein